MQARRLLALAIVVAAGASWVGQASACNTGRANDGHSYWTGATTQGASTQCVNGVQALEYITDPTTVGTDGYASSAWVGMEHDYTNDNQNDVLPQTGFANGDGGRRNWAGFAVETNGSWVWYNNDNFQWTAPGNGTFQTYEVTYGGSAAHIIYNGTVRYNWTYTGQGTWDGTCWQADTEGEIHSYQDQMPGTSGNQESWSQIAVRDSNNSNAWDFNPDQNWQNKDSILNLGFPGTAGGDSSEATGVDTNNGDLSGGDDPLRNNVTYPGQPPVPVVAEWDTCT
jgi:hypothetical protein